MSRILSLFTALLAMLALAGPATAQKPVRVGHCTSSFNVLVAPWAIAIKMGWDKAAGIALNVVPIATGIDCVKFVATGELAYAAPSVEPMAGLVAQGFRAKTFYTFYQGTTWAVDVPEDSLIKTIADLKGKRIGVISLAAVGTTIVKGLLKDAGIDPDKEVALVNVGEAARAALFMKRGEIDAVSIFDVAHLQMGALGVKLRDLPSPILDHAPSLGLIARNDYIAAHRGEAIAVARLHAMGSAFLLANPAAGVDIFYDVFPQAMPQGRDRAAVIAADLALIEKRRPIWQPSLARIKHWGEANFDAYGTYLKALTEWGMLPRAVPAQSFVTNELIGEINAFDQAAIEAQARAHPVK